MGELEAMTENKAGTIEAATLQNAALVAAASDQNVDTLRTELHDAPEMVAEGTRERLSIQDQAQQQMFMQQAQMREVTENLAVYEENKIVEGQRRHQLEQALAINVPIAEMSC